MGGAIRLERDRVLLTGKQLIGILDGQDPLPRVHHRQQRPRECRLAGRGTAGNQNIHPPFDAKPHGLDDTPGGIAKIIAGYHQFHAVKRAVASTVDASRSGGDRKVGVIWRTQGSGKSLLMAFYAGQLVREPAMENPTIVVITDRNDLDDQLFCTFSMCRNLIRQTPVQADSRKDLQKALSRASGGVVFTTIQKFAPEKGEAYPLLTDRRNVVVIADETHRSQYGFKARIEKTGEIACGFAKHLRDALPNVSFIGFTGTPIEQDDVNTPAVFGHYIDVYDIRRAVEDGATVPIYYESRLARIELPDAEKPKVDAQIEELTEDEAVSEQERLKRKWSTVEAPVGAEKRLQMVAEDLVAHFEARVQAMDGKAMVVCMSRRICVVLYKQIVAPRPDWHSDDDGAGLVKIAMTGSASDPEAWQLHIGGKPRRDLLAKRAKDPKDPLKLVIVRDMWLTGFDSPSMHTMYIDKPMRGGGFVKYNIAKNWARSLDAAIGAAMLARVPLAFSRDLDPGAVDQEMQPTLRPPIRNVDGKGIPATALGAEVGHIPVQTNQPQQAFLEPCRLPQCHAEQHLHCQAVLDSGVAVDRLSPRFASGLRSPNHVRIEPDRQQSTALERLVVRGPVQRVVGRSAHAIRPSRWIHKMNPCQDGCNRAP